MRLTCSAAYIVRCFGAEVLTISAYLGAIAGVLSVLPTEGCGSNTKLPMNQLTAAPMMNGISPKDLSERKSLETLVSKRVFRIFLRAQKDTAAARSGKIF